MHHGKTQEKELLAEKSFSFIIMFFITRVILLSKVWTNFSIDLPTLADYIDYIALLVKTCICHKAFYSRCRK